MNLLETLKSELARRQAQNPRYSLRAFARDLRTDHATLSQILRRRRNLTSRTARQFGSRLRLSASSVGEACLDLEAGAILRLARQPDFRPDSRWIATHAGLPLDTVNVALQRLLHQGVLVMNSPKNWTINIPSTHAQSRHPLADRLPRT